MNIPRLRLCLSGSGHEPSHNRAMPNIATVLKAEISRVARKEVRAELESLKKVSAQHRSTLAQLRRRVADLERELKRASKASPAREGSAPEQGAAAPHRRFSATRLAQHRTKLALSAASYGRLLGVSGQTVYNWEQGKGRPRAEQLQRLATLRELSRSDAEAQLALLAA